MEISTTDYLTLQVYLDKYYEQTGEAGLWNTGLFTSDFVIWLVQNHINKKVAS
jgi:hypothetical protein